MMKSDHVSLPDYEAGFSLSDFKQIIYRRWKPALTVGIITFGAVLIPNLLATPQFRSEASLLLNSPQNSQSAEVALNPLNSRAVSSFFSLKDLSTDVLVLRSYSLINKALEKYPKTFGDLSAIEVRENLFILPALVDEMPTDILTISFVDSNPAKAKAVLDALSEVYVEYSLERQRSQAINAIKFIDEQLPQSEKELNEASSEIRNFRQKNNLVSPDEYAGRVADFRQSLEEELKQVKIAFNVAKTKYQAISDQLIELGQDPETIVASSVLGQDGVYQSLASQLKDLETQYTLGSVEFNDNYPPMRSLKFKREELRNLLRERSTQILGDSISPAILDKVLVSYTQTNILATGDSGTQVSASGSTIQKLAEQLLIIQTEYNSLQSQLTGILTAKEQVEVDFQRLPQLQEIYTQLQRDFEIKSQAVNYLLQRKQELQIAAAEEIAPWQILDKPYLPVEPASPNLQRSLAMAIAAGGFLGFIAAWLLHKLDNNIKLVEEVKQITRLPLLGAVPQVNHPRMIIEDESIKKSYSYRYSSFTESLRAIAMNVSYTLVDTEKIKSIVTTSSTSSEGKTTVTYNLALALTELGARILVVDADLRKPKMHRISKIANEKGLSEIIADNEQSWTEVIQSHTPNLDIITAGANVANPIALLRSQRMSHLIEEWEEHYDYVLIDTPPLGIMADAQSLVPQVDAVMLVTGINRVSQKAISNTLEIIAGSNCNLIGFVANMVEKDLDYYSYSYYSHYYNQPSNESNGNGHEENGKINSIIQQFRRH
ncbi:MAG: polysaccharide biosynthesis tyrosine autokinase [Xenococcus sp. MO_188.B8]|nr:polysaccharide biosynthesis tyrosine autokinase [Xenococcus sp. MO_188.B8]